MKVEALDGITPGRARELWQKYQTHKHYQTPQDAQIAAIYKRIAQGHTVIRALESIRTAGMNADGLPKLAICRADMPECWFSAEPSGGGSCRFGERHPGHRSRKTVRMDWPGITRRVDPADKWRHDWCATVPLIPVDVRPRRALANYHILWEAEWTKRYPIDPYLLRRIGGDAWLVLAAWDLTEVERAVMAQQVHS